MAATPVDADYAAVRDRRVQALIAEMTPEQKVAQLVGLWMGTDDPGAGIVAPMQDAMESNTDFAAFAAHGLGQITRAYGTAPIEPEAGMTAVAAVQDHLRERAPGGVGALVHEECLTGFAAWRATAFPGPLAWGASWNDRLIERMAAAIGASMRPLGVHQGLAPVLDVLRDMRWGRVEETIAEDPYLVGVIGSAYVRGLQSAGIIATGKHFLGYSASQAGRNHAPVHIGRRELLDVFALPFEIAVREAGLGSIMHSYTDVDGVPCAADHDLLTGLLRERWGFTGTIVSDYFGVAFLHTMHGVAADLADAARQALTAGLEVELPTGNAFLSMVASGEIPTEAVDAAVRRVLTQKADYGLVPGVPADPAVGDPTPAANDRGTGTSAPADLDPPENRALARELAEQSVVLLTNDGLLPLSSPRRIALIGPNADSPWALMCGYHFPAHVLPRDADDLGIAVPTVADAVRSEWPGAAVDVVAGCDVRAEEPFAADAAVAAARAADVAVVVVGDSAGLFGRGTVGEGSDVADLQLPGRQRELLGAVLDSGTPVVVVALSGRGYVLDWAAGRASAIVQAFTAGEEGAGAVAGVLSGRVNPSGRLPVSMPSSSGVVPTSYLQSALAHRTEVSSLDPTPAFPFGHGLSYTTFESSLEVPDTHPTGEWMTARVTVTNTGPRDGTEIVQLYGRDPVSSVARPLRQLLGYARVDVPAGQTRRVTLTLPPARFAATGRDMRRGVEPGAWELWVGRDCLAGAPRHPVTLTGPWYPVDDRAPLTCRAHVDAADAADVAPVLR